MAGVDRRNALLRTEIELARGEVGNADGLRRALAESVLLVLRVGEDALVAADLGGISWLHAFTSEVELARYVAARGDAAAEVDYLSVRGDRLLEVLARSSQPAGLAVDVAGERPALFPLPALLASDDAPVPAAAGTSSR